MARYRREGVLEATLLGFKSSQHEAGVLSPKSERIREDGIDALGTRDVRNRVQVAARVRRPLVDRRVDLPIADGEDSRN